MSPDSSQNTKLSTLCWVTAGNNWIICNFVIITYKMLENTSYLMLHNFTANIFKEDETLDRKSRNFNILTVLSSLGLIIFIVYLCHIRHLWGWKLTVAVHSKYCLMMSNSRLISHQQSPTQTHSQHDREAPALSYLSKSAKDNLW